MLTKRWKLILGLALFFGCGNLAIKIFGNHWDGKDLLPDSIFFTLVFWVIMGALLGYFLSKKQL